MNKGSIKHQLKLLWWGFCVICEIQLLSFPNLLLLLNLVKCWGFYKHLKKVVLKLLVNLNFCWIIDHNCLICGSFLLFSVPKCSFVVTSWILSFWKVFELILFKSAFWLIFNKLSLLNLLKWGQIFLHFQFPNTFLSLP